MREISRAVDKKLQDNNNLQGKTFLTALFAAVRCILYPGTKIIVCSGTLKQANEVLLKIQDDFMHKSPFLCSEILKCNIGQNDSSIYFKNGSFIKTRPSTENARSARANILICDEYRMIDEKILTTVLQPFLTAPRDPGYLDRPEYAHLHEENKEIYMSSAYFKSSWAYRKAQTFTLHFLTKETNDYFICALPYQVSIKEGLLSPTRILSQMQELNYDEIAQSMEMECLWWGDGEGSFFKHEDIEARRTIKKGLHPLRFYNDRITIPTVPPGGKRILSVDVALMASSKKKKNDAAAIFINELTQTGKTSYQSNFTYAETFEGLTTDELGIIVMRYFYKYKCTDLVIDTAGLGIGVFDYIIKDQYDGETGKTYKALTCCNDKDMEIRCKVKDAKKVVWSVKGTPAFNNEIAVLLRNGIQNGKINFLVGEEKVESAVKDAYKNYSKLSPTEQNLLKLPYAQTTMMMYELIKLEHEVRDGKIKVKEASGMRKDRYSSVAYSFWCATQLERKLKPKTQDTQSLIDQMIIRPGKRASSWR